MNELNLLILLWCRLLKNKQKQLKIKDENKLEPLEALKPKEIKPKTTKPVEYSNYFLEGLAEIRKNNKPIDFYDLTNNFKDPEHAPRNFIRFKVPNSIFSKYIKEGNPKNMLKNNVENL